jgi:capsid protein
MGVMADLKSSVAGMLGFGGVNTTRDAARNDLSEFSGWRPNMRFAGNVSSTDWSTITGRARDLDENNGWVNGGLDRRVEAVIGVNIRLSAQPRHTLLNRDYEWRMKWTADVQERFGVWGNDIERRCDARRRLNFGALAKLAYLTYSRDGEVACEVRDDERGIANTTNVMLVESERISTPPEQAHNEGPRLRNGVAYDESGAAIGYWVRSGHPNDPLQGFAGQRWDYVPAAAAQQAGRSSFTYSRRAGLNRLAAYRASPKSWCQPRCWIASTGQR